MDFWKAVLSDLKQKVSSNNFESWLREIQFEHRTRDALYLSVETPFLKAWIEDNYLDLIDDSVHSVLGRRLDIDLMVGELEQDSESREEDVRTIEVSESKAAKVGRVPDIEGEKPQPVSSVNHKGASNPSKEDFSTEPVDSSKRFENFVQGPANEFAYRAARSVADDASEMYNPLVIFGETATGKTHLLHAIAHELDVERVECLPAERFVNRYVAAIQNDNIDKLRRRWRHEVDALFIDDLQFMVEKELSSEELVHTIDALEQQNCQIVFTLNGAPGRIDGLDERLKSRLMTGLSVELKQPAVETRIRMIESMADRQDIDLGEHLVERIARRIGSSASRLQGLMVRLGAKSTLMGVDVDRKLVDKELAQFQPNSARGLTVSFIIERVAEEFDVTVEQIKSDSRKRCITRPRQYAMYLARQYTDKSYPALGKLFGGKNHTTVLNAYKKIDGKLNDGDNDYVETVDRLEQVIGV